MFYTNIMDKLNKIIFAILVIMVAAMVVIGGMQVFWRYVLRNSLHWSEEIMRYLNIWTIFLGISIGIPKGIHVSIDAVIRLLKKRVRLMVTLLIHGLTMIFFILLIVIGIKFTTFNIVQVSPAVRIPLSYIYVSLPIGGILGLLFTIDETIKSWKGGADQWA